jgi:hypothetical protein
MGVAASMTRLVQDVATLVPWRAQCLEQSLMLYVWLRRRGIAADLRLGAQALPFAAHAWIEIDGRPINALPEFLLSLAPFPELPG